MKADLQISSWRTRFSCTGIYGFRLIDGIMVSAVIAMVVTINMISRGDLSGVARAKRLTTGFEGLTVEIPPAFIFQP